MRSAHPASGLFVFVVCLVILSVCCPEIAAQTPHDPFFCSDCHDAHGTTGNIANIRTTIDTPNSGPRSVVFLAHEGPNSFADGDAIYDGVCEVCHTVTNHHRNDPSGDHGHYAATNCTACHPHSDMFMPTIIDNHPQAATDCSNCHLNRETQEPDLLGVHGNDCQLCHPVDLDSTILGPIGTWTGECGECHDPSVPETGGFPTPTKGHRCIVCHGASMPTTPINAVHKGHIDRANCVVCHGFVPDVGTQIGSGDRNICEVCHDPGEHQGTPQNDFHKRHVPKGASCLECHGDVRPPIDVVDGPPVGNSTNVCEVCHTDRHPSEFIGNSEQYHEKHTKKSIDCGACHMSANLQDDRDPMPEVDDPVRSLLDRSGTNECFHCHAGGHSGNPPSIHKRHVEGQWQWCYNCHEGTDLRPLGGVPPITQPSEACVLCHSGRTYDDAYPFDVHHKHSGNRADVKCYTCHQATAPITAWPTEWRGFFIGLGGGHDSRGFPAGPPPGGAHEKPAGRTR